MRDEEPTGVEIMKWAAVTACCASPWISGPWISSRAASGAPLHGGTVAVFWWDMILECRSSM